MSHIDHQNYNKVVDHEFIVISKHGTHKHKILKLSNEDPKMISHVKTDKLWGIPFLKQA